MKFNAGDTIYSPFSDDPAVFMIESGYVMALTYEADGRRRIHLIYGPGSYFPVITTFKNTEQRATYEALCPVATQKYSRAEFNKQVADDGDFARAILAKTVDQLAIFADRVVDLQFSKLEDRLLSRLKILIKDHGTADGLPYKLKHSHLADMLGAERESVTRALNRLIKKGSVKLTTDGVITVTTL